MTKPSAKVMAHLALHCYRPKVDEVKYGFKMLFTSRDDLQTLGKHIVQEADSQEKIKNLEIATKQIDEQPDSDENIIDVAIKNGIDIEVAGQDPEVQSKIQAMKATVQQNTLKIVKASEMASKKLFCSSKQSYQVVKASLLLSKQKAMQAIKVTQAYLAKEHCVAYLNIEKKQLVIACKGLELTADSILGGLQLLGGNVPPKLNQILRFVDQVVAKIGNSSEIPVGTAVYLAGHSTGGNYAKYITLTRGYPSTAFDNPGLNLLDFSQKDPENFSLIAERGPLTESYLTSPHLINSIGDNSLDGHGKIFLVPSVKITDSVVMALSKKLGKMAWQHHDIALEVVAGMVDAVISAVIPNGALAKFFQPGEITLQAKANFFKNMKEREVGKELSQHAGHLMSLIQNTLVLHKAPVMQYALLLKAKEVTEFKGNWPSFDDILKEDFNSEEWLKHAMSAGSDEPAISRLSIHS